MASHLLLAGYLGSGNLGDDAVMLGFVEGLKGADVELTALSGSPEETYRLYGIPSKARMDWGAINTAIEQCDALVFPGGSIFQDTTSFRSVAYYRTLVRRAKAAKKKVFLVGQGVGPLKGFFSKRLTAAAFNMADGITVRDPSSMSLLRDLGVKTPIKVTADTAFLLPQPREVEGADYAVAGMKTVGLSIRPHGKGRDTVQLFGQFTRLLFQNNFMPVLIEMDKNEDAPLIQEISKEQGGKVPDLRKLTTPMQVQQRLSRMDSVIAMRLHAGILASTVGVPPMMVSYDPKVAAFAKSLEIGAPLVMEGLTPQRLMDSFLTFQKDRERNIKVLERRRADLANAARENAQIVLDALK